LVRKALSYHHKITQTQSTISAKQPVEQRRCRPKAVDCTYHGRDADDHIGNGNDDRIAVLGRPNDASSSFSGIEAIEGLCPSLVWSILAGWLLHVL
jgi:hypothetical protein